MTNKAICLSEVESHQSPTIISLILNNSFFLTLFTFMFSIFIWYPLANVVENHYLYAGIGDYLLNLITSWFVTLNIYGSANQALGFVFSFIGITGFIVRDYFLKDKKYIGSIFAVITVIYLYWGVSTFYLYQTVKTSFVVHDFTNYSGCLSFYICEFILPIICLWYPFHSISKLKLYTYTDYLFNELTIYEKFIYIKDLYRNWIRHLIIPWVFVGLAVVHTSVLITLI